MRVAAAAFAAERERWVLWLPVGLGLGIGSYFALPAEPPPWLGAAALAAIVALAAVLRRRAPAVVALAAMAAVAAGFAAAQVRTVQVAAPVLAARLGPVTVSGRVVEAAAGEGRVRLLLEQLTIGRVAAAATPARIRISLRGEAPPPRPGERVRLRAVLLPPAPPAAPGAFDFARQAYFDRIGAVGFAFGRAVPEGSDQAAADERPGIWLRRLRQAVTVRILAALPETTGAVAAALMTGERGAIPAPVEAAMRDSGLAHLLSISGLHLALIAGILFFAVRLGLAAVPPLALAWPIKKWAAGAALTGAFAYLLLSGAAVPTQRAFAMTAVVLLAVMTDRRALTMRLVGWSAVAVLLLQPESLLSVSFQMSFAAVVALTAAWEAGQRPLAVLQAGGVLRRGLGYLAGVAVTTLVAGTATAPYAVYHFNRFVDYGLVANLVAVPLTGLWIMPWAVAAFLLMPFGGERLALQPMGWGIDAVIAVAETVAAWPGAVLLVAQPPLAALLAVTAGGLWLCLWHGRWRLWGIAGLLGGCLALPLTERPDILVDGSGRLLAVRAADGRLMLSPGGGDNYAREVWLRRDGAAVAAPWPGSDGGLRCDAVGCSYRAKGHVVAWAAQAAALAEDCRHADLVISRVPRRGRCPAARRVIDRFDLWRHGAHAVYLKADGDIRIEHVQGRRGDRPWSRPPAAEAGRRRVSGQ